MDVIHDLYLGPRWRFFCSICKEEVCYDEAHFGILWHFTGCYPCPMNGRKIIELMTEDSLPWIEAKWSGVQ